MHRTRPLRPLLLLILLAPMLAGSGALAADQPADAANSDTANSNAAADPDSDNRAIRVEPLAYATIDNEPVRGYLARPRNDRSALPAVLLIHDQWGLNKQTRSLARRFANEGYVALAVDLYGGQTATRPDDARELEQTAANHPDRIERNLRQAVYYLDLMPSTTRIGVIGWGSGGTRSLQTALALPQEIAASVLYYADTTAASARLDALQSPVLALYGSDDARVPPKQARNLDQTLTEFEKPHEVHVYQGAAHDFPNPTGDAYSADAAGRAWADTLAFLNRHLNAASQ